MSQRTFLIPFRDGDALRDLGRRLDEKIEMGWARLSNRPQEVARLAYMVAADVVAPLASRLEEIGRTPAARMYDALRHVANLDHTCGNPVDGVGDPRVRFDCAPCYATDQIMRISRGVPPVSWCADRVDWYTPQEGHLF